MSHPLHPALVHFPVACWSLATVADLAGAVLGQSRIGIDLWAFAGTSMAIGTLAALAAMAAGFAQFLKLDAARAALRDVQWHMLLATLAWSCYATSLWLRLEGTALARPGTVAVALGVLGFLALCAAGWFGGRLVYTHGIGVAAHRM